MPSSDFFLPSFVFFALSGVFATAAVSLLCTFFWCARPIGSYFMVWGTTSRPKLPSLVVLPGTDTCFSTPGLTRFAEETRSLVCDLWGVLAQTRAWPTESSENRGWRKWFHVFGSGDGDSYNSLSYVAREIWGWVRTFESLDAYDQEELRAMGIDVHRARESLEGHTPFVKCSAELLRWLIQIDERLHCSGTGVYRDTISTASGRGGTILFHAIEGRVDTNLDHEFDPEIRAANDKRNGYFEIVMNEHRPTIVGLCRKYTRCSADAEDLLQDITMEIWRALPRFRQDCSLRTYVLRIARFRVIDYHRRRETLPEVIVGDPDVDIEQHVVDSQRSAALRGAIRFLPNSLREVLCLRLQDHSYSEIAEKVGISETNVSVRLSRARDALRRRLCGVT